MGGLFSKPKVPAPPPAPPVVTVNDARQEIDRRNTLLRRKGYLSTILDDKSPPTVLGGRVAFSEKEGI